MKVLRENGLTIVLIVATMTTLVGMMATGISVYNDELARHHQPGVSLAAYLASGHFLSALFENWESEFLQMSAYVALTASSSSGVRPDPGIRTAARNRTRILPPTSATRMRRCPSGSVASRSAFMPIPSALRFSPSSS